MIACADMSFSKGSPPLLLRKLRALFNLVVGLEDQDPVLLFTDAMHAGCSNPRDKIFGILGLIPHALSQKIQPRYTESIGQVYKKATLAYFESSGSLNLLVLAAFSWVPDLSIPRSSLGCWTVSACSGNSTAEASYVAPDTLRVTGVNIRHCRDGCRPITRRLYCRWDGVENLAKRHVTQSCLSNRRVAGRSLCLDDERS
jgi:hypothetical protein